MSFSKSVSESCFFQESAYTHISTGCVAGASITVLVLGILGTVGLFPAFYSASIPCITTSSVILVLDVFWYTSLMKKKPAEEPLFALSKFSHPAPVNLADSTGPAKVARDEMSAHFQKEIIDGACHIFTDITVLPSRAKKDVVAQSFKLFNALKEVIDSNQHVQFYFGSAVPGSTRVALRATYVPNTVPPNISIIEMGQSLAGKVVFITR